MKIKIFTCIAVFFISTVIFITNGIAAIINAASASYSDVSYAVSSARAGDTVIVPAGSVTWDSVLTITKGITLQGAGVGKTVITGNVGTSEYLVQFIPTDPSLDVVFQMTGFTFNLNRNSRAFRLKNTTSIYPFKKIKINNNSFINCISPTIEINGPMYGVIYNNTFNGTVHFDNYAQNSLQDWSTPFSFGSANNLYYEDNVITSDDTWFTGGHGGRYVARYNTFLFTNQSAGLQPWFDMHGNQPPTCNVIGPRGGEIYGNKASSNSYRSITLADHRGGRMFIHNNWIDSSTFQTPGIKLREEYCDEICTKDFTMHVNDSYYWNNRYGTSMIMAYISQNSCASYQIKENVDYFMHTTSFDGSSGMGCGPASARPATCTPGVGYWETNQSCTTVDSGSVGAFPAVPISGTLYKCTAPNTWTAYYTPYAYPHPLRDGDIPTAQIAPPSGFRVIAPQ